MKASVPITWPGAGERGCVARLGDAEVGQPRVAVLVDEHVLRLDVAMQDARAVDVAQGGEQLAGEALGLGHVTALQAGGEVAALDVLHHEIRPIAGAEVVHRDQVRVLEGGRDLRLAPEPADVLAVCGERVGEDLDRDRPVESLVGRQPDHRHPAGAQAPLEHIATAEPVPGGDQLRLGERGRAPAVRRRIELVGRRVVVAHVVLFPEPAAA